MRRFVAAVSVLMLSGACAEGVELPIEKTLFRDVEPNDVALQGPGLQLQGPGLQLQGPGLQLQGPGLQLQGPGLQLQGPGLQLQGVSLNGPGLQLQGPGLQLQGPGLQLQGSQLTGTVALDGVEYDFVGTDFIDAVFYLRLEAIVAGVPTVVDVELKFDDIQQSEQQDDVYLHYMSYRTVGSGQWLPYCGDAAVGAVPLKGYWDQNTGDRIDDPNVITFGCANAALGKCTLWGYRPWATATRCPSPEKVYGLKQKAKKCETISLQDHHQACTRMARADYCGNGQPATVNGTAIDIWDTLSPPIQTQFTDWPVEAEWGPDGATCLNYMRHPEFGYPACFLDKKGKPMKFSDCGSNKKQRSQLISAFDAPDADGDQCGDH